MIQFPLDVKPKTWNQVAIEIKAEYERFDVTTLPQDQRDALAALRDRYVREGGAPTHLLEDLRRPTFVKLMIERGVITDADPTYQAGSIVGDAGISDERRDRASSDADIIASDLQGPLREAVWHLAYLALLTDPPEEATS